MQLSGLRNKFIWIRRKIVDDLKCIDCKCEFEEIDMEEPNHCPNCGSKNYDFKFDVEEYEDD